MKALVTGGTGTVGRTLVRCLDARGWQVRVLGRSNLSCGDCNGFVEFVQGDIADGKIVEYSVKGVDVVFHLAARLESRKNIPYSDFERVNVTGTQLLVNASKKENVQKIVFASSISVYGRNLEKSKVDETTSLRPDSHYSLSKAAAEKLVLKARNRKNEKIGVILRAASVYGPKEKSNYTMMIRLINFGILPLLKSFEHRKSLIHDFDFARGAIMAALSKNVQGKIYNVTDGNAYRIKEIADAISKALGKKYFYFSLPFPDKKHLLKLLNIFSIRGVSERMFNDKVVAGEKFQKEVGFKPLYSLDTGWADTVNRCLNRDRT